MRNQVIIIIFIILYHNFVGDRPMLEGHTMIDTGEKPFYCEICGNNYALKGSLRTHIKQKHDNYVKLNNYEYCQS